MSNRYGPKLAGSTMTTAGIVDQKRQRTLPDGLVMGDDFPLLCSNCLGDPTFLRMQRLPAFSACRMTQRPFNVFRWRPGKNLPFKETVICYEIAAEKNICQCCLNDLEYNIPMALRDAFEQATSNSLSLASDVKATSVVNRDYMFNEQLAKREQLENTSQMNPSMKLLELAQSISKQDHNQELHRKLPGLCSKWLQSGACNKKQCTFRPCGGVVVFPELNDEYSQEEIRSLCDRVRQHQAIDKKYRDSLVKILQQEQKRALERTLEAPEDQSIMTLFLLNIPTETKSADVSSILNTYGKVDTVKIQPKARRAFVTFVSREDAEQVMSQTSGIITLGTTRVTLGWAAKRKTETTSTLPSDETVEEASPPIKADPISSKPLPCIFPGVPIPAGMSTFNEFAPVISDWKPKKLQKTFHKVTEPVDFESTYPSLQASTLEGNVELYSW